MILKFTEEEINEAVSLFSEISKKMIKAYSDAQSGEKISYTPIGIVLDIAKSPVLSPLFMQPSGPFYTLFEAHLDEENIKKVLKVLIVNIFDIINVSVKETNIKYGFPVQDILDKPVS